MSDQEPTAPPIVPPVASAPSSRFLRIEYLGFQNVAEHREYRFCGYAPEGRAEFRVRIGVAAFGARRVRMQDGPDICYQKLLVLVAGGDTPGPDVITIDEADLENYRVAHTPVQKQRRFSPATEATPFVPRTPARTPYPRLPVAPPAKVVDEPPFPEGQRVNHALFGDGVTGSSADGHTVVSFDKGGPKTFVTSLLKLDVLSATHTWEIGPRGNRPRAERA